MDNYGISLPWIISCIVAYFFLLLIISRLTSKGATNETFFTANKKSPWYLVAFGMIGATLSGVTFISVPGWVRDSQFSYFQMVLGYLVGYAIIALILMPMYYKMKLTSIYTYLEKRIGPRSYKTGAAYFLLSRTIGASFRLYLVAIVFQSFIMDHFGIPFWFTVAITILLIWIYTYQGGIKTIVITDTIQTASMLFAVLLTIFSLSSQLNLDFSGLKSLIINSSETQAFFFDGGWSDPKNFIKQFLAGAFIAIVMTGLDQDMMQKNLSCRNIKDAQKNMFWFSIVLVFAKLLFLILGFLLLHFAATKGINLPDKSDLIYPTIALNHLSPLIAIFFLIGLIAAAYSSADSALTALTTSFCIDFLNYEKVEKSEATKKRLRMFVHIGFSVLIFCVILAFYFINNEAVISAIFRVASYTYGPLLGLYAFGFFTKRNVIDKFVPYVCLASPVLTYLINENSEWLLGGYKFGFELLILNGLITFLGLIALNKKETI